MKKIELSHQHDIKQRNKSPVEHQQDWRWKKSSQATNTTLNKETKVPSSTNRTKHGRSNSSPLRNETIQVDTSVHLIWHHKGRTTLLAAFQWSDNGNQQKQIRGYIKQKYICLIHWKVFLLESPTEINQRSDGRTWALPKGWKYFAPSTAEVL